MRDADLTAITSPLTAAGYIITYLVDNQVTVKVLATQLNKYDVVIWRTNVYTHEHTTYWYVGETLNQATSQEYSSDFSAKWLDSSHGIIGASPGFFQRHFGWGTLSNVKVAILVSSVSSTLASFLLNGGVRSVVEFCSSISLEFGTVDIVTGTLMNYLSKGYDVADAVSSTVTPYLTMQPRDPLDSVQVPALAFTGDATVTIT